MEEQYNMELALRFLIFKKINPSEIRSTTDLGEFVTEKMRLLAVDEKFDFEKEEKDFIKTFEILDFISGENVFKKFDANKGVFAGKFLISGFEAIAYGLGKNIDKYESQILDEEFKAKIISKIKAIWEDPSFQARSGSGMPATMRIPTIVPIGEKAFAS